MSFPSTPALSTVIERLQNSTSSVKAQAQNALTTLQGGTVDTLFIYAVLDQLSGLIAQLNSLSGTTGLNAYATANLPGYAGTMTNDITAIVIAAQAVINWIVAYFPASSGWLQAEKLNADGSRTMATFTSAQTAGLQSVIQAFIATIS